MTLLIPPKPAQFHPEVPPPGFFKSLVPIWQERPFQKQGGPRLQVFHTNAASGEGTVESAIRWAMSRPHSNTLPHLQIDRTHGAPRGALLLPSNRRGIGNATDNDFEDQLPTVLDDFDVSWFSLVFETADTGTRDDPSISAYDEGQLQLCSNAAAYYHVLHNIPLEFPDVWYGYGTGSHTDPFPPGYWSIVSGKTCPGLKKKAQLREVILPHARRIVAAWNGPVIVPPPPPLLPPPTWEGSATYTVVAGDGWYAISRKLSVSLGSLLDVNDMTLDTELHPGMVLKVPGRFASHPQGALLMTPLVLKYGGTRDEGWTGYVSRDGGWTAESIDDMHHARLLVVLGAKDARTGAAADMSWSNVSHTNNPAELKAWLTPGAK